MNASWGTWGQYGAKDVTLHSSPVSSGPTPADPFARTPGISFPEPPHTSPHIPAPPPSAGMDTGAGIVPDQSYSVAPSLVPASSYAPEILGKHWSEQITAPGALMPQTNGNGTNPWLLGLGALLLLGGIGGGIYWWRNRSSSPARRASVYR